MPRSRRRRAAQRKDYLLALAKAVSRQVLDSHASATALVKAAGRAAGERRLLVYSTDPTVQAGPADLAVRRDPRDRRAVRRDERGQHQRRQAGLLPRTSLNWRRTGCGRDARRDRDDAVHQHRAGLRIVALRRRVATTTPLSRPSVGDSRCGVNYYATRARSGLRRRSTARPHQGRGHERRPRAPGVTAWTSRCPAGRPRPRVPSAGAGRPGAPVVLRQPLVRPVRGEPSTTRCCG